MRAILNYTHIHKPSTAHPRQFIHPFWPSLAYLLMPTSRVGCVSIAARRPTKGGFLHWGKNHSPCAHIM